jgi:RHS repeat-associated protein
MGCNVINGSNTDIFPDFKLAGPFPLLWQRYYNSLYRHTRFPFGWGHTHEYHRYLRFDADGISYSDAKGFRTAFPYLMKDGEEVTRDGYTLRRVASRRFRLIDSKGVLSDFEFSADNRTALAAAITFGQYSIKFFYTEAGYLRKIIDSLNRTIRVENDSEGRVLKLYLIENQSKRHLISYLYDKSGNLIEGLDPYQNRFSYEYNDNLMIRKTDRRGYSFFYEYDLEGRCVLSRGEDSLHEVSLKYLPSALSTIVTRADGGDWIYKYDKNGQLEQIIDPYGGVESFVFNHTGDVEQQVDPNGVATRFIYDRSGDLQGRISPLNRFIPEESLPQSYERNYVPLSPIEWEMGGNYSFSAFTLPSKKISDSFPPQVSALLTLEERQESGHRPFKPVGLPEPPGEFRYDMFGNLISHKMPTGEIQRWSYDENGNVIRYIDAEESIYRSDYSSWNLLTSNTDPLNHLTTYAYTPYEKLSSFGDAGGSRTRLSYDLKDRLTERSREGRIKDIFRYDLSDNLIEKRDTEENLLLSITVGDNNLPQSIQGSAEVNWNFSYDERGRQTCARSETILIEKQWDESGNQTKDQWNNRGVTHLWRGFDLSETTLFDKFRISFKGTGEGEKSITDPTGAVHRIKHLGDGVFLTTLSNGTREVSQYQSSGRCLAKIIIDVNGSIKTFAKYSYTPEGDLRSVESKSSGLTTYSYDKSHRLITENGRRKSQFKYDNADNLVEAPELKDVKLFENRILHANQTTYEYNNRNHIARSTNKDQIVEYRYNSLDQLIECRTAKGIWKSEYDPTGRRLYKEWNGSKTFFYWDRERLAGEILSDGRVRIYVYIDAHTIVPFMFVEYEDLNSDQSSGKRFFIFTNQIGCPTHLEDDSGNRVWAADIYPFGKAVISEESSISFNLRWPGHYWDQELGLQYNRHRYYSPELCRYIQSDPIDLEGGSNVYAYTTRPLTEVDLDGRGCRKPILRDPPDSASFNRKRDEATALAARLRQALDTTETGRLRPDGTPIMAHDNMTLAVLVVREGGEYRIVVASSTSPNAIPPSIRALIGDHPVVNPPRRRPDEPRFYREGRQGNMEDTGRHAEQRGLRWADSQDGVEGVGSIHPTRPCCPGCTSAIQARGDPNLDSVTPAPYLN